MKPRKIALFGTLALTLVAGAVTLYPTHGDRIPGSPPPAGQNDAFEVDLPSDPGGQGDDCGEPEGAGRPGGLEREPVDVDVSALHLLNHVRLNYPPLAKMSRLQGDVLLHMVIDPRGLPVSTEVLQGPTQFHPAAIRAAQEWRFTPVRVDGEAVAATCDLTLPFRLDSAAALPQPPPQSADLRAYPGRPFEAQLVEALAKQGIRISADEARRLAPNARIALQEARAHGLGDSKVDFACVEMGQDLGLDLGPGSNTVNALRGAVGWLLRHPIPEPRPIYCPSWDAYYDSTLNLWQRPEFMAKVQQAQFSPVKISWEDIGRYENSVWGDRISDVGIWVRRREEDPSSARLALSVRRDSNFRDKVLVVPADRIKVHRRSWGRTIEQSLPERLRELGLQSQSRDRSVIVSNQFAIVPVPARNMAGDWRNGVPPRAAFTFSIFPYGSTNFVITDVIEGSSEAIVGPGAHQLLYSDVNGRRAPFTASRAEDRQDLLQMERELKARGMDVDVQRYYLIQIPLKRDVSGLQLSNMGTPPMDGGYYSALPVGVAGGAMGGVAMQDSAPASPSVSMAPKAEAMQRSTAQPGLSKVAIGHGESEGGYFTGAGWRGQRAEEPIRITVVYFVTPVGEVTERDMAAFSQAFKAWDRQAIWGGSFVTKESF